jgi:type III pantothenate kinase
MITPRAASDKTSRADDRPTRLNKTAVVAIDVGNMSITLGGWEAMKVVGSAHLPTSDRQQFPAALTRLCTRFPDGKPQAVVLASVVPDAVGWIRDCVASVTEVRALVVGSEIPLPIPVAVREPDRVGVDRVCAAAAAFDRTGHACTIVDFGTAVTVDLVDDRGTFVGGAILPGPALQARILAEGTTALPEIGLAPPEQSIGRDTVEAIRSGIYNGIAGAVRGLVEQYATVLNTWPQVVATGGDLEALLPRCDFIDNAIPDLALMGVGLAYARHRDATR